MCVAVLPFVCARVCVSIEGICKGTGCATYPNVAVLRYHRRCEIGGTRQKVRVDAEWKLCRRGRVGVGQPQTPSIGLVLDCLTGSIERAGPVKSRCPFDASATRLVPPAIMPLYAGNGPPC